MKREVGIPMQFLSRTAWMNFLSWSPDIIATGTSWQLINLYYVLMCLLQYSQSIEHKLRQGRAKSLSIIQGQRLWHPDWSTCTYHAYLHIRMHIYTSHIQWTQIPITNTSHIYHTNYTHVYSSNTNIHTHPDKLQTDTHLKYTYRISYTHTYTYLSINRNMPHRHTQMIS